jgi:ADP-ribosylglycohydrolase
MIGALAGDIVGSVYEAEPIKSKDFSLFDARCRYTDDSVMAVAVAKAILEDGDDRKAVQETALSRHSSRPPPHVRSPDFPSH